MLFVDEMHLKYSNTGCISLVLAIYQMIQECPLQIPRGAQRVPSKYLQTYLVNYQLVLAISTV